MGLSGAPLGGHFHLSSPKMAWAGMRKAKALAWKRGNLNIEDKICYTMHSKALEDTHIQWGKKVFSQPPIVQVLPLKKMREACNLRHAHTYTHTYLIPNVVWMIVVIPTQVKMVPTSWLTVYWSCPTHMASASRKGTAMVPLKHVR